MRPERPLPPQAQSALGRDGKGRKDEKEKTAKEKKKRVREPNVRARRRTIDPTRWDSVHLKGMFLDVVTAGRVITEETNMGVGDEIGRCDESKGDDESEKEIGHESYVMEAATPEPSTTEPFIASPTTSPPAQVPQPSLSFSTQTAAPYTSELGTELAQEKLASLSLLHSLFGTRNDDDWIGRESVGSDIDEDEVEQLKKEGGRGNVGPGIEGDEGIEEVPMDLDRSGREVDISDGDDEVEVEEAQEAREQEAIVEQEVKAPVRMTNLKDLFAPREEEGSFRHLHPFTNST
jgi:hypothetical protein